MIGYASNTCTRRNLEALRVAGWRILLTPDNPKARDGLRFAIDNGAWSAFKNGTPFDAGAFEALLERYGSMADFVIAPDIVAGGLESLKFSVSWLLKLTHFAGSAAPTEQHDASGRGRGPRECCQLGLFLGGSTSEILNDVPMGDVGVRGAALLPHRARQHGAADSACGRGRSRFVRWYKRNYVQLHSAFTAGCQGAT